jgi:hypothetical protein
MDYWIAGLLQIKELCKKLQMGKIQNAYSEVFLELKPINPIIH